MQNHDVKPEYTYTARWTLSVAAIVMFGGAAAFFVNEALTSRANLEIERLITLNPDQARYVYWFFVLFCATMAALAATGIARRIASPGWIAFGPDALIIRHSGRAKREEIIRFREIQKIELCSLYRNQHILIEHSAGKSLVNASDLAKNSLIEQIYGRLAEKVNAS